MNRLIDFLNGIDDFPGIPFINCNKESLEELKDVLDKGYSYQCQLIISVSSTTTITELEHMHKYGNKYHKEFVEIVLRVASNICRSSISTFRSISKTNIGIFSTMPAGLYSNALLEAIKEDKAEYPNLYMIYKLIDMEIKLTK